MNHGIKKALANGISEYLFVISEGIVAGQEAAVRKAVQARGKEVDLAVVDIWKHVSLLAVMLNPSGRAKFGACVVRFLREMRKYDSANAAAELWNRLTGV